MLDQVRGRGGCYLFLRFLILYAGGIGDNLYDYLFIRCHIRTTNRAEDFYIKNNLKCGRLQGNLDSYLFIIISEQ